MFKKLFLKLKFPGVKFWKPESSNISLKAKIGKGSIIHAGVHIHDEVVMGNNCRVEGGAFIPNGVYMKDGVFVGPHAVFTNDPKLNFIKGNFTPVKTIVNKNCRIGANACIRAGVILGENSIIGMGSVILKDVPSGEMWVGNPAKFLRKNE